MLLLKPVGLSLAGGRVQPNKAMVRATLSSAASRLVWSIVGDNILRMRTCAPSMRG